MPSTVDFDNNRARSNFETVYMDMAIARNHITFVTDPKGVVVQDDESVAINN